MNGHYLAIISIQYHCRNITKNSHFSASLIIIRILPPSHSFLPPTRGYRNLLSPFCPREPISKKMFSTFQQSLERLFPIFSSQLQFQHLTFSAETAIQKASSPPPCNDISSNRCGCSQRLQSASQSYLKFLIFLTFQTLFR